MKLFVGWSNIRWFIREIIKLYSAEKSYFSKKRIESGLAFIIGQWGMIFYMLEKHSILTMSEVLFWAATEFAIAGYMLKEIQKEKATISDANKAEEEPQQINS